MKYLPRRNAFALVLVMITIVLAATMAVFFLGTAGRERRGVDLYARGSQVRHLAGMTVSRVMGQINAATKEGTAATPVSWASQPGMVRTYAANGNPSNVYKLYSWDNPVEAGTGFVPTASTQVPPSGWKANVALFTDLNQPINDVYPIVDPGAVGVVQGFSIDANNAAVSGTGLAAPMPVKWLYVLEDGQIVAPSGGSGNTAVVPGATTVNPIIGRVAYWTDDETSKVNINTASEGAFWDVPRSGSRDDIQLAGNPPVRYEFQRTPGHPAMTSLSAVFPELLTEDSSDPTRTRWGSSYKTQMQAIYGLSPRLQWGSSSAPFQGSQGGTYPITSFSFDYPPGRDTIALSTMPRQITLDTDRLYASADEVWFQPNRSQSTPFSTLNPASDGSFDSATQLVRSFQRRLFFLTANSRAPETTLFETPRISLWPITWPNASSYFPYRTARTPSLTAPASQDPNTTKLADINPKWITAEERLLAFCSTLNAGNANGGDRYFFQRKDPDSPVNDWTTITRNRDLVGYLRRQMGMQVPGFGSSLQATWGGAGTANWIALNSLNYVRSLVNQYTAPDAQEGIRYSFTGVSFRNGRIGGVAVGGNSGTNEPNAKMASPLRATIDGTEFQTVGNYPMLEEVSVVFYAAKRNEPVPPVDPSGGTDPADPTYPEWRNPYNWQNLINLDATNGYPLGAQTTVMRAVMLLDFTGLEPGVGVNPVFWVKVRGGSFTAATGASSGPIGLPSASGLSAQCTLDSTVTYNVATTPLFDKNSVAKIFSNSASGANVWQLVSNDIPVSPADLTFSFGGSEITVEVYSCDPANVDNDPTGNPSRKIYEKSINFGRWNGTYPIPIAPRWSAASRAYRFDANGAAFGSNTNGALPGGTLVKTTPAAANPMTKFARASGTDRWQPNPGYASVAGAPPGLNTAWAWSEYAPAISIRPTTGAATPLTDPRSVTNIFQARARNFSYVFRGSIAGYTAVSSDPDDFRENTTELQRNISTNFRKRVEALDQRNTGNRPAFCLEGHTAVAPVNFQDPNLVFSGTSITADYFIQSNEIPLKESLTLLTPYDTVISMVNALPNASDDRDPRLAVVNSNDDFQKVTSVLVSGTPALVVDATYPRTTTRAQWHAFGSPGVMPNITGYQSLPTFRSNGFARRATGTKVDTGGDLGSNEGFSGLTGAEVGSKNKIPDAGDWTGMPGRYSDGGLLTRPDQEYQQLGQDTSGSMTVPFYPRVLYGDYTGGGAVATADLSYFSPNRQVPSPVILGTLPSSMTNGWQTLAFSPNPANSSHPGLASAGAAAPDHLLLDLFWMPVAEPYPISELFSTAGKVNLNYRMMPFSYIERKTALFAAMKSTWITALTDNANNAANYKSHVAMRGPSEKTRYAINVAETLAGFDVLFNSGRVFRSASELCEFFLVPQGRTLAETTSTFWNTNRLTADNAREQPYDHLYSRVTTKSNTFTVHWRVQALRKVPTSAPGTWDESKDRMASELRGSTLVERYLDPNATNIPDYATDTAALPLSNFYKWRVVSENFFQP
ncbi:MAG: Verru_Chthon cassette protein A [Terrimicrobiaceae bacterium]